MEEVSGLRKNTYAAMLSLVSSSSISSSEHSFISFGFSKKRAHKISYIIQRFLGLEAYIFVLFPFFSKTNSFCVCVLYNFDITAIVLFSI